MGAMSEMLELPPHVDPMESQGRFLGQRSWEPEAINDTPLELESTPRRGDADDGLEVAGSGRGKWAALIVVLLLAGGGAGAFFRGRTQSSPSILSSNEVVVVGPPPSVTEVAPVSEKPVPAIPPGRSDVVVDSVPSPAQIISNGRVIGETPEVVSVTAGQTLQVIIRRDGWEPRQLDLDPTRERKVIVRLVRERRTGREEKRSKEK